MSGGVDYLVKPVRSSGLLARMRKAPGGGEKELGNITFFTNAIKSAFLLKSLFIHFNAIYRASAGEKKRAHVGSAETDIGGP